MAKNDLKKNWNYASYPILAISMFTIYFRELGTGLSQKHDSLKPVTLKGVLMQIWKSPCIIVFI